MSNNAVNPQYKIKHARLSFPALFHPKAMEGQGQDQAKFSCALILDKRESAATIKEISDIILAVGREKWGGGGKAVPWKQIKVCLRDGSEKEGVDGYGPGVKFLSASSRNRVPIVDTDPSCPLVESDGRPYAGCIVNAVVRFWAQDNQFGKRVNAQLQAVQFVDDGDAFGDKPIDPSAVFSAEGSAASTSRQPAVIDPADIPPADNPFNDGADGDDEPF